MHSLYIVENQENEEQIVKFFKAHYPHSQITIAKNKDEAIKFMTIDGPFNSIFIDSTIKTSSPTQLAKDIIQIAGNRPITFLGSKKEIDAYIDSELFLEEDSLCEILYMPLVPLDVKNNMETIRLWNDKENFNQSLNDLAGDDLLPIRVSNFFLFKSVSYDVFIELAPYKYLKIINKDEPYTIAQLTKYSRKNIKNFLLTKDDFILFIETGIKKVSKYLKRGSLKTTEILSLQVKGMLLLHQYVNQLGISNDIIIFTNLLITSFGKTYDQNKTTNLTKLLRMIPIDTKNTAQRSLLNIYLIYGMLNQLDWNAKMTRGKLALAAILADSCIENDYLLDITHTQSSIFENLEEEMKADYLTHPLRAAEYSKNFQGHYSDVDFLIAQHHETPLGDGFPSKINHSKLTSLSCLFIITTRFVSEICREGPVFNASEITKVLKHEYNIGHFREPLNALVKALKA